MHWPEHQAVAGDAGVVDQHVDAAEVGEDLLHGLVRLGEVGGVGRVGAHLDAERLEFRDSIFDDLDVRECDVRPFFGELQGDGLADAPGCARDEGDFSFQ